MKDWGIKRLVAIEKGISALQRQRPAGTQPAKKPRSHYAKNRTGSTGA